MILSLLERESSFDDLLWAIVLKKSDNSVGGHGLVLRLVDP